MMSDTEQAIVDAIAQAPPPIAVNPSPVPEQLASTMRVAGILIGGIAALTGFLSANDLKGAIAFLRSSEAYPFIGACVMASSYLYGQFKTRRNKAKLVVTADAAPNHIAYVVQT